jgi:chromosome partitioning protein
MRVVAIYNMKGGVGKTTAAVNLAYLAAAAGQRALLWDLDPQAASSFAFRVRPRVARFDKKSLESGRALVSAIKETDYENLDLLPADFAYRKLDRLLDDLGKPRQVIAALLKTLGRDYETVFLDCPAGFSLLTEGVMAAADVVLVPTIPTVLSLRTVARIIKWADRSDSPAQLAAFFSMVDRRKALHRQACEWPTGRAEVFLSAQIPYASVVEQMSVRRLPLAVFAARDSAAAAFAEIWAEIQTRLRQHEERDVRPREQWMPQLRAIEKLIARLESPFAQDAGLSRPAAAANVTESRWTCGRRDVEGRHSSVAETEFVHRFDTDGRDLERRGYVLALRERTGNMRVVAARSRGDDDRTGMTEGVQAQIDNCWALEILSGLLSPLVALERRLSTPKPPLVEKFSAIVGEQRLQRIESRVAECVGPDGRGRPFAHPASGLSPTRDRANTTGLEPPMRGRTLDRYSSLSAAAGSTRIP